MVDPDARDCGGEVEEIDRVLREKDLVRDEQEVLGACAVRGIADAPEL